MDNTFIIRNEAVTDYKTVEAITKKAFWNLYVPGCIEHYLVHQMRTHKDFLPELDFVIEVNGQVIGNIMYTKAKLTDEAGVDKEILTFGPVSILPEYQRKGYGKKLIEHSIHRAAELGYEVIVLFGNPYNYVGRGFKCCKKSGVCTADGIYPMAMLVKELHPGVLDGRTWVYRESPVYDMDERMMDEPEVQLFDSKFETLERAYQPSQEEFYIYSHAVIQ